MTMDSFTEGINVKIFADGASLSEIISLNENTLISGFTTNPTLMRKSNVTDYKKFALEVLSHVKDKPISFEVFADTHKEMLDQAKKISSWGDNVYVKIPVTTTKGESNSEVVKQLITMGIKVNVTAIMTIDQIQEMKDSLESNIPSYLSIFAGRIADTGRDPVPIVKKALEVIATAPNIELIWASPRELLNVIQASDVRCHIITATSEILSKLDKIGYSLKNYSLDTVRMFYDDARASGYLI